MNRKLQVFYLQGDMHINKFQVNESIIWVELVEGVTQFTKFGYIIFAKEFYLILSQYSYESI